MNEQVIVGLNANLVNTNNENKNSVGGSIMLSAIARKSLTSVKKYNSSLS
jgi:hypothetical protein